jgi:hypothetical protein
MAHCRHLLLWGCYKVKSENNLLLLPSYLSKKKKKTMMWQHIVALFSSGVKI